jgi:hypothetical protein
LKRVSLHDFVKVEADRGEDLGIVMEMMTMAEFSGKKLQHLLPTSVSTDEDVFKIGFIIRLASSLEKHTLPNKYLDEQNVLKVFRIICFISAFHANMMFFALTLSLQTTCYSTKQLVLLFDLIF